MASFYAELYVAGHVWPVRTCEWEFTQATDGRGRVIAKVRHGLVHIVLDVPQDTFLEDWVKMPYKPLPGCVVFFETKGSAARETLSWEEGHGVGYFEEFLAGSLRDGAYICRLTIAAPKLVMTPGGPPRPFVAPTPREHGSPQVALLGVPAPLLAPGVAEAAEVAAEVAAVVAPELLPLTPVLVPPLLVAAGLVAAVLALLVATTTPAYAPGLPHRLLVNPDELRLRELVA